MGPFWEQGLYVTAQLALPRCPWCQLGLLVSDQLMHIYQVPAVELVLTYGIFFQPLLNVPYARKNMGVEASDCFYYQTNCSDGGMPLCFHIYYLTRAPQPIQEVRERIIGSN